MAKRNVRFEAVKTVVAKPLTVRFKTKSGQTVSFTALNTIRQEQIVPLRAKAK
jgi:hypothetical protein